VVRIKRQYIDTYRKLYLQANEDTISVDK